MFTMDSRRFLSSFRICLVEFVLIISVTVECASSQGLPSAQKFPPGESESIQNALSASKQPLRAFPAFKSGYINYGYAASYLRNKRSAPEEGSTPTTETALKTTEGSAESVRGDLDTGKSTRSWTKFEMALCMPEYRSVELERNPDPHVVYVPRCVRAYRCGGCCNNELFECRATQVDHPNVTVSVFYREKGKPALSSRGKKVITHENHLACQCKCRVQTCAENQFYNEDRCRCECRNEFEDCEIGSSWDSTKCNCVSIFRPTNSQGRRTGLSSQQC